ncbi:MAG: nucleoside deaminase [Negativicutes bacterium]|nr:nucleoside deaminase [Negativicutes bacterium]
MRDYDLDFLRMAIETARKAREHGNHPFGAVLVDAEGQFLMEAENTVNSEGDCTGHAETNLIRKAYSQLSPKTLAGSTLYTSTEPCAMCSGAIFWGGVNRVVYALSEISLFDLTTGPNYLKMPCREVFFRSGRSIEVLGPLLVEEARKVHEGFWK